MGLAVGGASLLRPVWAEEETRQPRAAPAGAGKASRVVVAREEGLTVKRAGAERLLPMLDRGMDIDGLLIAAVGLLAGAAALSYFAPEPRKAGG